MLHKVWTFEWKRSRYSTTSGLESSFNRRYSDAVYRARARICNNAKCITLMHNYNYKCRTDLNCEIEVALGKRKRREREGGRRGWRIKGSSKILLQHALLRGIWYNVMHVALKYYISKYTYSGSQRNEIASYILLERVATRQLRDIFKSLLSVPPVG